MKVLVVFWRFPKVSTMVSRTPAATSPADSIEKIIEDESPDEIFKKITDIKKRLAQGEFDVVVNQIVVLPE